jgi:hypothetical protein
VVCDWWAPVSVQPPVGVGGRQLGSGGRWGGTIVGRELISGAQRYCPQIIKGVYQLEEGAGRVPQVEASSGHSKDVSE